MKILQLYIDEKFVDVAIDSFSNREGLEVDNMVLSNTTQLRFVKSKQVSIIDFESYKKNFQNIVKNYDAVFFHALIPQHVEVINQYKKEEKIYCWFLYGYDYYDFWKLESLYLYTTYTPPIKDRLVYNKYTHSILKQKPLEKLYKKYYADAFYRAVQKIDYVVTVLPNEFKRIKRINNKLKYLPFSYGNLETYLSNKTGFNLQDKRDILLGNSAAPTNNHLEIIDKLGKIDLEGRKVIAPLSYSGSKEYIDKVIKEGKQKIGDNFIPLTDFIPLEQYNNTVFNCGYAIFNHVRQQAMGNILVMGYLGAKLFLNSRGVVADFLKQNNVVFTDTQHLNNKELTAPLSDDEIGNNQKVFDWYYSPKAVEEKINMLCSILKEDFKTRIIK